MTHVGCDKKAALNIVDQGFLIYTPRYLEIRSNGKEVERLLFPSYIFVEIKDRWRTLSSTRGVSRIVTFNGKPSQVPEQIITQLRSREGPDGFYHFPQDPPFKPGERLRSTGGLLKGHFCVFQHMTAQDRVRVLFEGIGFRFSTEVPLNEVESDMTLRQL